MANKIKLISELTSSDILNQDLKQAIDGIGYRPPVCKEWKLPSCFYTDITELVDLSNVGFHKCFLRFNSNKDFDSPFTIAFCYYFLGDHTEWHTVGWTEKTHYDLLRFEFLVKYPYERFEHNLDFISPERQRQTLVPYVQEQINRMANKDYSKLYGYSWNSNEDETYSLQKAPENFTEVINEHSLNNHQQVLWLCREFLTAFYRSSVKSDKLYDLIDYYCEGANLHEK